MAEQAIIQKATEFHKQLGGTIFAFPIEENNPHSEYAVVVYAGNQYFVYPQASDVSLAASGVVTVLDLMKQAGLAIDYENDVRFISYKIQIDAPNVVMRRLKNQGGLTNV
jgi:hypothetical protein